MFKLKQKLENMSAPVKAALFFTICNVLQKGISLISAPIFTRLLTTEQYGLFTIYNSWYGIISIFATFNLSYGIFIKGLVKYEDDSKRFASSLLGLSTTITFACFLVYLIGMNFWNSVFELPSFLILAMFLELLFVPAFGFWSNIQRNEYKYKALVLVTLEMSLANPLLGIVTVLSTIYKAEARILSMVFVQVIFGLFFYILIMYKGRRFYDKKYWKYAFLFNAPLIPHYLS
ncbi:MAG: lipopolysaccharide biosynthesis protein, partial [Peptoniphilus grossensis]